MAALIEVVALDKTYNRHQRDEVQAVRKVSLQVEQGEVLAFKGPSGSGKTSLLSLIGCMTRPTAGQVKLDGRDISRLQEHFLAAIRRERFGFIFQQFNLIPDLNLRDNILLPLYPTGMALSEMKMRASELLLKLDLESRAGLKIRQLSGGEQQRVAIARALINQPEIIIADEPTAHLDSDLTLELLDLLGRLNQSGKTIIIATHDPRVYNHPLIQRTLSMQDGELLEGSR